MADQFIDVEIEVDDQTLADNAVAQLQTVWPDWVPNDGDPEVVQIEALAPMAGDTARAAAVMPSAAFRTILAKLHGIAQLDGAPAGATVTFHMTDAAPHRIDEGFAVDIDGVEFTVIDAVDTAALEIPGVAVVATEDGTVGNDLVGDVVTPITASSFISDVTLDAPTEGGEDTETDAAYEDRGSRLLELQAVTLVVERDYELWALGKGGIGRAVAIGDEVARQIDVTITDENGEVVPAPEKADLAADYDGLRKSTWNVAIHDATYTDVTVTTEVKAYPGYDPAALALNVAAALDSALNPAAYGAQTHPGDSSEWINDPRVRRLRLVDIVASVPGVNYVVELTIAGSAGVVEANGDLTMPGTVALPRSGAHDVTVS